MKQESPHALAALAYYNDNFLNKGNRYSINDLGVFGAKLNVIEEINQYRDYTFTLVFKDGIIYNTKYKQGRLVKNKQIGEY